MARKHFSSDAQRIADGQEWYHFKLKDGSVFSVLRHRMSDAKQVLMTALERRKREHEAYNKKRNEMDQILTVSRNKYREELRRQQVSHGDIDFNELTFWDLIEQNN